MSGRRNHSKPRKKRQSVEDMPTNFCKLEPLSPRANEKFIARAAELNRTLGHMIRAWHGFKSGAPEDKPYWRDIYQGSVLALEKMHAEINYVQKETKR